VSGKSKKRGLQMIVLNLTIYRAPWTATKAGLMDFVDKFEKKHPKSDLTTPIGYLEMSVLTITLGTS
jgi:hypothetical protein